MITRKYEPNMEPYNRDLRHKVHEEMSDEAIKWNQKQDGNIQINYNQDEKVIVSQYIFN